MLHRVLTRSVLLLLTLPVLGCRPAESATDPRATRPPAGSDVVVAAAAGAPITPADRAQAKSIWTSRCVTCHGAGGKGDGPAASGLNPKVSDFADAAVQRSFTDEQIAKAIVGGGVAVGQSQMMPANKDLAEKPGVVQALREMIRGFAHK
jgi:mono/diheme cytochrome c family protein